MRGFAYLAAPILAASTALAASICNGDAALCDRLYSNVTYVGTHNSYAVGSGLADNQDKDVTGQLNDGVRALQVQTHNNNGKLHVCHSDCRLKDGGTFEAYLQTVASWLNSNPNDVVSLVIVNSDNLAASEFGTVFTAAGLNTKAYTPQAASMTITQWPTLGAMIDAGTNLVVFMDYDADFTSVPYIMSTWSNMWEDAYDVTEPSFACGINRTDPSVSSASQMYMINHFLDTTLLLAGTQAFIPNKEKLTETNAASGAGSIGFHADNCVSLYGRNPNIILLDFYDSNGNAPFEAVASMNGVAAPTNTVTPGNSGDASATASDGASAATTAGSGGIVSVSSIGNSATTSGAGVGIALTAVAFTIFGAIVA